MKMPRWCRFLCLAFAGGTLFQTTTSCTSQLTDALVSSVSTSLTSVVQAQMSSYIDQLLGNSSST
jgi:hypothetical protein